MQVEENENIRGGRGERDWVKVEDEGGGGREGWRRWSEERGETNKNPAE
jgi:hypothetical protein